MLWEIHRYPASRAAVACALALAPAHARAQAAKTGIDLSFEKASAMSGAEQVAQAEKFSQRMKDHLRRGFELLEQARSEKDIVKLNAINEKLSSMKGLLKIAEQAMVALQEAVARRDKETADHEYTKIAIAAQKVDGLALEAEGAVGENIHYTGDTRVEVTAEGFDASDPVDGSLSGAGADVPGGARSGAAAAAASAVGGASTQQPTGGGEEETPVGGDETTEEGGTWTETPPVGENTDFNPPPIEDVVQPSASPGQ